MKALQHCAGIPSVATMIVKSLHRILQLAPDQTVCAFKNLEALLLLSQVMDIQLQEYIKFSHVNGSQSSVQDVLEDVGGAKLFTLKESWKLSREAVFDLFAEYVLTSEEARIISLHSTKTMQVLFDLLWDSESRRFALGHILDLMKVLCLQYSIRASLCGSTGKLHPFSCLFVCLFSFLRLLKKIKKRSWIFAPDTWRLFLRAALKENRKIWMS